MWSVQSATIYVQCSDCCPHLLTMCACVYSVHGTKELFTYHPLFSRLGQTLGGIPLGLGLVVKINLLILCVNVDLLCDL